MSKQVTVFRVTAGTLDCGHAPSPHSDFTTGYGTDAQGKRHCYACCAENEKKSMRKTGRATLYLTQDPEINTEAWKVTDWPGTLRFPVGRRKFSRYGGGFGAPRTDVWFMFENETWHGVNRGSNAIIHCKRIKS